MAAIRALFGEHEEIRATLVAGALGLSARRVREILQQLTDAGVLMKQSDRRSARYMLALRQKGQSD
jgi:predicted transcriptional regulator